ncbi:MAG TPA: hypothetical protein VGP26_14645 [Actinophytocola sp.]|jgi:hypothetical protein|nr:hypothetical protein [Actinophytocola sp.]
MPAHSRQLKLIEFTLGGTSFECQINSWTLDPGIPDGDIVYTFCPDGATVEDGTPEPSLQFVFLSDWREDGISRYLTENSGSDAAFQLDHLPDIPAEHVRWTGTVRLKAPPVGGEARSGERTEITLQCIGDPTFVPVGA